MDINEFAKLFPEKINEVKRFAESEDIKDIIATEAINHFKQSFKDEGFTNETLNPWKEVKRRDPASKWYGHSGQTGKFSAERTTAPILTGETRELQNAFSFKYLPNGVRIINDKPYAAVHQYGLPAKVYGKTPFVMPARPFVGHSPAMYQKIIDKIKRELQQRIK